MVLSTETNTGWQKRKRPIRLERRYNFDSYDSLRDFLDEAANLSETMKFYPDMGFGKNYVNMTIHLEEGTESISDHQQEFAARLDKLSLEINSD